MDLGEARSGICPKMISVTCKNLSEPIAILRKEQKNTKHTNDESFLLLANSYDHPAWDAPNRKEIREGILSVMTVHIWGMSMIDFVIIL